MGASGFGAPDFEAPDFGTPGFVAPDFGAPGFEALDFGTPHLRAPGFGAPGFGAPGFEALDFGTPSFGASDFGSFPDPVIQQAPFSLPSAPQQLSPPLWSFSCTQLGCARRFRRDSDRTRHQSTVHSTRQGLHLCPVAGCPKSYGGGFSRRDKLTEHKWKKHADLGYTKRVL